MKNTVSILILTFLLMVMLNPAHAQKSGSIWVKSNKPGSADYKDSTIDQKSLQFVDSLMLRDDIVVTFLGGADKLPWKGLPKNTKISQAFDQAKKLERALALRKRYGRGEVGVTDEPIRGVKVVWEPKPPDAFKLLDDLNQLQAKNDSLLNLFTELNRNQKNRFAAIQDSINMLLAQKSKPADDNIETVFTDWEVKTGLMAWSGSSPYDLAVPCVGIALKRRYWAFEIGGGFTPWGSASDYGRRGDAILTGAITLYPRNAFAWRGGIFSGWEFLTKTDNWTMKVLGVTAGPVIKWKIFEGFIGYSFSRLSTLTLSDQWNNGIFVQVNFKFLIN